MEEVWKEISRFNGRYLISNYGQIKIIAHLSNKRKKTYKPDHILKQRLDRYGYPTVGIKDVNGKKKPCHVHQEVARAFISSEIKENDHICHRDGNKRNNYSGNLYIGNQITNTIDKYIQKQTKLTMEQVLEIRKIGKSMLQKDIAEIYGVHRTYIGAILNGVKARHITTELVNKLKIEKNGKGIRIDLS
jgi:hypothetical protein